MVHTALLVFASALLITACPGTAPVSGDTMPQTVEEYRAKGRQWLIDEAARRLKERDATFEQAAFDQVSVRASDRSVWVTFVTSIVLLREGQRFTHSQGIDLVNGSGAGGSVAHPHDLPWTGDAPPFLPDHTARSAVVFVLRAANTSDEVGDIPEGKLPAGSRMTIRDCDDHYEVSVDDPWMTSTYHVSKSDGTISEAMHAHSIPDEDPDSETFEELAD